MTIEARASEDGLVAAIGRDGVDRIFLNADGTVTIPGGLIVPFSKLKTGAVLDSAYAEYATYAAVTAVIPVDDTLPLITEGTQILSVTLTPKNIASRFKISAGGFFAGNVAIDASMAVFSSTVSGGAIDAITLTTPGNAYRANLNIEKVFTPGVITPVTISVRVGPGANTMYLNGTTSARYFGGAGAWKLSVEEIK